LASDPSPLGRLADGTPYYAPIGELLYDPDGRVCCHLCGHWFQLVGGTHVRWHGWTLDAYRDAFHLLAKAPTCTRRLSARYRHAAQVRLGRKGFGTPPAKTSTYRVARWRSLAHTHPELLAELHPTRNSELDLTAIGSTSHRRVWWQCQTCGQAWQAAIGNRTLQGSGCPACALRRRVETRTRVSPERSIAVKHPELAAELHPTRNATLDPYELGAASTRVVWWRCQSCGHEWPATVANRASGHTGCPNCWQRRRGTVQQIVAPRRSLAVKHPELAAELHPTRNRELDAFGLGASSSQKLWWRCDTCAHEWKTAVSARSRGTGCPRCFHEHQQTAGPRPVPPQRSLAARHPELVAELHPDKTAHLDPRKLGAGSGYKAWWQCPKCGHEWQASVDNRSRGSGCPACAHRSGALGQTTRSM